jgi:aminopeptidase N
MIKKTSPPVALSALTALSAHADPLSYARYDQVRTTDLYLDLKADFSHKILSGYAELTLNWIDKMPRTLVLDTNELNIAKVQVLNANGRWTAASFMLDKLDVEKGRALRIALPFQPQKVRVYYRTAPSAAALQWMSPEQTMSGKRPFMFSQSQDINARSWAPVQDTPAVRFTYSARIDAPAGLRVVMSAENDQKATGAGGWKFKMAQPIPSYLLAIAIGESKCATSARAPPCMPKHRASKPPPTNWPTPKNDRAAESLYGPYRWERYDMIVLPPSFPYGGMENPRLTFLTPTMIAGDRSLVT